MTHLTTLSGRPASLSPACGSRKHVRFLWFLWFQLWFQYSALTLTGRFDQGRPAAAQAACPCAQAIMLVCSWCSPVIALSDCLTWNLAGARTGKILKIRLDRDDRGALRVHTHPLASPGFSAPGRFVFKRVLPDVQHSNAALTDAETCHTCPVSLDHHMAASDKLHQRVDLHDLQS